MNPSLVARINKAFEGMPFPAGQVVSVETQDDEGTTEHFLGTRWQEHTPESLQNFTALSFFTPEAFCYYLPAYMLAAMKQPRSGIADSLIEYLCPPKNNPKRSSYWVWWSRLSTDQRRCIVAFLEEFRSTNPARLTTIIASLSSYVEV